MEFQTIFKTNDIMVRFVGGFDSSALVVTFESYTNSPNLSREGFGESFFKGRSIDAIHVINRTNAWYQYPEMDEALAIIREYTARYQKVFTYGASMGGYAALRFASQLNAETAIAIAPQYSVDPVMVPFEFRWNESRMIDFCMEKKSPITAMREAIIFYDPQEKWDRRHVDKICNDIPVTHVRIPYSGHMTGCYLSDLGMMAESVSGIINGNFNNREVEQVARRRRREAGKYYEQLSRKALKRHPNWARSLAILAQKANPANTGYMVTLAEMMMELGELEEAEKWQRTALEREPENLFIRKILAVILKKMNRLEEARSELHAIIANDHDRAECYHLIADTFALEGLFAEAIKYEEMAVSQCPSHRSYNRDLKRFKRMMKQTEAQQVPEVAPKMTLWTRILNKFRYNLSRNGVFR